MKKSIITVATVTVVGLGSVFLPQTSYAETVTDLENKQVKVQDERSQVKVNLSKAEKEIATILVDLKEINGEIKTTSKALKENQKKIDETKDSIEKTEDEIDVLDKAIEERFDILKQRAVSYQQNGGDIGFLDVIFGSSDFNDFISRVSAVTKITESDQKLIDQIDADKQKVEGKLADLEEMEVDLKGMQDLIIEQKEENEKRKKALKKKEEELVNKKEKLQMKDSDLASLESQIMGEIEASRTPVVENVATTNQDSSETEEVATTNANTSSSSNSTSSNSASSNSTKSKAKASAPTANPAPAANTGSAISAGYSVTGTPYVWGGKGPGGFDCSGFVSWAYGQAGKSLPSSTAAMSGVGTKVSYSNAKPGDLVFFDTYKTNGHVGIYLGGGKFLGAQNSTGVAVASMSSGYWKEKFDGHVRRP